MSLSSGPGAAHHLENTTSQHIPAPKRRRLNLACNYCRSRKTRCDERRPSCYACLAAGLECITTDPRRPNRHVERREAGKGLETSAQSTGLLQTPDQISLQPPAASTVSPESAPTETLYGASGEEPRGRVEEEEISQRMNDDDAASNDVGERFRGLLPIFKQEVSSTSVDVLTGWLNVASFRLNLGFRFTSRSALDAEQDRAPFPVQLPSSPLGNHPANEVWVSNYFQIVHPVYPVVDKKEVYSTLNRIQAHGLEAIIRDAESLPQLVIALVTIDIGSSGPSIKDSDKPHVYHFLKDLLGRLVGRPAFSNIKALFLLALDMYHHDEVASAWSTLTLCITMMIAVGLGKSKPSMEASDHEDVKRLWWSAFALEKFLAFEIGRRGSLSYNGSSELAFGTSPVRTPAETRSVDAQGDVGQQVGTQQPEDITFFKAIISLAKLLDEIGRRCIDVHDREEASGKHDLQRLVAEKVKITGESCVHLMRWAETLPDNLRPGSDLIYDRRTFPRAVFLSLHYYNSLLVLTRNSLLISESALRITVEVISKNQPWGHVIRNGQPTVANNARRLIKLLIDAEDSGIALLVPHTNASLHALYVLTVHLMRHPDSMLRKSDLDLIKRAAHLAKQRLRNASIPMQGLCSVLTDLSRVLEQGIETMPRPRDDGSATTFEAGQTCVPESVSTTRIHSSESSDLPMYTLPDATGFGDDELLSRLPQSDYYNNDALYCYGMDIGTWVGLDSVSWDQA